MNRPKLPGLAEAIRLAPAAQAALRADDRRIVVVGAGGWIGCALLAALYDALGNEASTRIACFGSQARDIAISCGRTVRQAALADLPKLSRQPSLLFHLAFLTKDKVGTMDDATFCRENRALSRCVLDALEPIGVDRLFLASSGAAAFAGDPAAKHDLRLYGALKRDDEDLFAGWADAAADRRALIVRIFSLAGPFINKHGTYAFASFILDALAERPIQVRAPIRVLRSYVAVRELLSLSLAALLAADGPAVRRFDSGGEALELGEVAQRIAAQLGGCVERAEITGDSMDAYTSNPREYHRLLGEFGVVPVPLEQQIAETATYLSQIAETDRLPPGAPVAKKVIEGA